MSKIKEFEELYGINSNTFLEYYDKELLDCGFGDAWRKDYDEWASLLRGDSIEQMPKRFEYRYSNIDNIKSFNELGEDGWEMTGIKQENSHSVCHIYWKREICGYYR